MIPPLRSLHCDLIDISWMLADVLSTAQEHASSGKEGNGVDSDRQTLGVWRWRLLLLLVDHRVPPVTSGRVKSSSVKGDMRTELGIEKRN